MDYKYIEQLLERYWNGETTVEEEDILRAFFRQSVLPAHLARYRSFFACMQEERQLGLGDDFDRRVLAEIERPVVKARRLTLRSRFLPLYKAAAMMVLLFTVGGVVKHIADTDRAGVVYVYDQFDGADTDPQMAEADTVPVQLKASSACQACEGAVRKK